MAASNAVSHNELINCPDCGEHVRLEKGIESNGQGVAFSYIECTSDDCDFHGREEWTHDLTIDLREESD